MGLRDKLKHADRQREADDKLEEAINGLEVITRDAFRLALHQTLQAERIEDETPEPTSVDLRDEVKGDPHPREKDDNA